MDEAANILMITVFWLLVILWIVVPAVTASHFKARPLINNNKSLGPVYWGFIFLSIAILLDSIYWALANSRRVEFLTLDFDFYNGFYVSLVKLLLLAGAVMFVRTFYKTLERLENRVEALYFTRFAAQSIDAIGVLDIDGTVLFWNQGAEKLFGFESAAVVGKSVNSFLVPDRYHEHLDKILNHVMLSKKPVRFRSSRRTINRTEILVDISISPMINSEGTYEGFFGVMREVPLLEKDSIQTLEALAESLPVPLPSKLESDTQNKENTIFNLKNIIEERYTGFFGAKVLWMAIFTLAPFMLGLKIDFLSLKFSLATVVYIVYHCLGLYIWINVHQLRHLNSHLPVHKKEKDYRKLLNIHKNFVSHLEKTVIALIILTVLSKGMFTWGHREIILPFPPFVYNVLGVTKPISGSSIETEARSADLEKEPSKKDIKTNSESIKHQHSAIRDQVMRFNPKMIRVEGGVILPPETEHNPSYLHSPLERQPKKINPFLVSETRITKELFQSAMKSYYIETGKKNRFSKSSTFAQNDSPNFSTTWRESLLFCNRLSEMNNLEKAYEFKKNKIIFLKDSTGFRLLSDHEWRYAAQIFHPALFQDNRNEKIQLKSFFNTSSPPVVTSIRALTLRELGLYGITDNFPEWIWNSAMQKSKDGETYIPIPSIENLQNASSQNLIPHRDTLPIYLSEKPFSERPMHHRDAGIRIARSIPDKNTISKENPEN